MCLGAAVEIYVPLGFQNVAVLSTTKPKLYELSWPPRILIPMCEGWCQKIAAMAEVPSQEVRAGLGRLSFAATLLVFTKPFVVRG